MHNTICLNCDTVLTGKFCHECGQKADTHRITAKHFIMHDLLHGVWHIEKGILFTLKEVFTRPGYAALDYIQGRRVKYYNIFYLILMILGLIYVLGGYVDGGATGSIGQVTDTNSRIVFEAIDRYMKLAYLLFLPIMAAVGFVLFRKLRFNFSEHLIIAGVTFLGMSIFVVTGMLLEISGNFVLKYINNGIGIVCALFPAVVYYQVTRKSISLPGYLWRIVLFYVLIYGIVKCIVKAAILVVSMIA